MYEDKDNDIKEPNQYPLVGFIFSIILMVGFPYFWYWFFKRLFGIYETNGSHDLDYYTAVFIGFFLGFIFQMICVLKGVLKDSYNVYKVRRRKLKENLKINFKFAMKIHFSDIKEYGIGFTIYMIVIYFTFFKALNALIHIIFILGIV